LKWGAYFYHQKYCNTLGDSNDEASTYRSVCSFSGCLQSAQLPYGKSKETSYSPYLVQRSQMAQENTGRSDTYPLVWKARCKNGKDERLARNLWPLTPHSF
jgi:hypothetical protein